MRSFVTLIALSLTLCLAAAARGATFSSSASSAVSAVNFSGLATSTFAFTNVPFPAGGTLTGPMTAGNGVITVHSFTNTAGAGTQSGAVSGSALGPPSSFATAGAEAHDFVEIFNNIGGTPAVLTFTFSYSAASTVAAAVGDEAVAGFNFHITGADDEVGELLEVDTGSGFVAVSEFEVDMLEIASMGDTGASVSDSIVVRYTGAPLGGGADGEYAFSIFTRASGLAASPASAAVPEPATIGIWVLGLLACVLACRWLKR